MRFLSRLACLLVLLLTWPVAAQAPDPDLPQPDPPGVWRDLTLDDSTSTSRCIGNPVTPLCAVETYWACFLRKQPELCDIVGAGVRPQYLEKPASTYREQYRIVYARRPSPLDPVDPVTEGNMKPQPGDIIIGLMNRFCVGTIGDDSNCLDVENNPLYIHMLRRQGDFWAYAYRFRPRF